jgi:hypothetical protein
MRRSVERQISALPTNYQVEINMKKLLLGSLVLATVGQAAGCIIVDDTPSGRTIGASWAIKANDQIVPCPPGFDTARVTSHPHARPLTDTSANIIDLFNCANRSGITAPLPANEYDVYVDIINANGTSLYAQSLAAYVDLRSIDQDVTFDIHTDKGYYALNWALSGAGGAKTCDQVAGLGAISLDLTPAQPATEFACNQQSGVSRAYPVGVYQLAVAAINTSKQQIGTAATFANAQIQSPNKVTTLGTAMILVP